MRLRDKMQDFWGNFATRLVAGLLIASLPITIVLGVLLTKTASSSLSSTTRNGSESIARAVALRMEDWTSERRENVDIIAARASGQLGSQATANQRKARCGKPLTSRRWIASTTCAASPT